MRTIHALLSLALSLSVAQAAPPSGPALSLEQVKAVAAKAEAFAAEKGWDVSIAIVDGAGNLLYFQRDPDAYVGSLDSSIQKARSANAFQRPTKAFEDAVAGGRLGLLAVKDVVPIDGGVPIQLAGKHVGGIGVSGARAPEDAEVARAGLTALK